MSMADPLSLPEPCFDYEACLKACAQGDHQALRALYTQESARLLGVARRIAGDNALAEDIVHDAFIRIWTKAARLRLIQALTVPRGVPSFSAICPWE